MEKIGIYMKKVKFNESQIQYIIKESMEPDYIGTIDDIDGEIPQEDDWRSDEPSQGYVQSTFETIEQQCNACGAIFKNMGDNEFGVIIKDMGSANELVDSLKNMEESGIIYNTGGDLSMGRVKYRIIKEINENRQVNEAYDMNQGTGAYELYEYFRVLASQGNEEAKAKMEDLIQNHHYEICEQLAWIFRDVYKENGYSDPMINSQCTTYIQRIEGSEGNEMSEELQLLGKRYLRMLNDPNLSFIDLEELGLCVYEEMKKYAEKYRKKLDQNNKKRREARMKQSEIQKVSINEEQLKQIVSESVKMILCEIGDTRRGQYKLGKLWRRKYDDVWDKGGEDRGKKAYDAAKSISDYAHENNRKSFDGKSAFDLGSNAKWNEQFRNQELAKKGKTKRKSEAEIYKELSDKDAKENVMSPDEVYKYSLEWLKSHEKMVLRYKGDSYAQKRLSECGCKNLGDYIIYCYENEKMPGWIFFQIYANKIYKELNLYYDGSTANADKDGFVSAWEDFCEYVYETYKSY